MQSTGIWGEPWVSMSWKDTTNTEESYICTDSILLGNVESEISVSSSKSGKNC